jgi:3-phosphoshikimate 1-carboxyvinyltransferase
MKLEVADELAVPGDKSISHRALLLAALASGESRLRGLAPGADCRSTAAVLRRLGCRIPPLSDDGAEIRIAGEGAEAWLAPGSPLDCGNSGTTARLLAGVLASRPFCSTLTGDASLRGRPMERVTRPLSSMGASFHSLAEPDRLPLEVCGARLQGIEYRSPHASAQVKSALLLAGLTGGVPVTVHEPALSRDHTERLLASLGVALHAAPTNGGWRIALAPHAAPLPPLELTVPGDPSSAAFFVALALLAERGELRIRGVCVNPTRTGFLPLLARMGARLGVENESTIHGEPVGDLVIRPAALRGITITAAEVPAAVDEIPLLAVLAARAEGTTIITGASELRVKETDRITALVSNLRALGVEAGELPDGLAVPGADAPLIGRVRSCGDHRIAMAFGVLGALPGSRIEIDDTECVGVSYPGFWSTLRRLSGGRPGANASQLRP